MEKVGLSQFVTKGTSIHSSLSRLHKHHQEHQTGTISAFRDNNHLKRNLARNKQLKSKLLAADLGVTAIRGVGQEEGKAVSEDSFFVVDLKDDKVLRQILIQLGQEYHQDSITYAEVGKPYDLISTNKEPQGTGSGKVGVEIKLGSPKFGREGEFFSTIRGRPFLFSTAEVGIAQQCKDINERQAKRLWSQQSVEKIEQVFFPNIDKDLKNFSELGLEDKQYVNTLFSIFSVLRLDKPLKINEEVKVGVIPNLKYASNKPEADLDVLVSNEGDKIYRVKVVRPDGNLTHNESLYFKDLPNFLENLEDRLKRR